MNALILVPTEFERGLLEPHLSQPPQLELCGFGVVTPAARTAKLISDYHPELVILAGIAGSYSNELSVGSAYQFSSVACYGVGVGSEDSFQTAGAMGWPHWPGSDSTPEIRDAIHLPGNATDSGQLLTVCSAAAHKTDVDQRTGMFPDSVAEDMEGFAVAVACQLAGVPLQIVRGISNMAGNRNHKEWQIESALLSVAECVNEII